MGRGRFPFGGRIRQYRKMERLLNPRDVRGLPKAHLHLHFTGSMRPATLLELAAKHGVRLPEALSSGEPPKLRATDERITCV